jgi:hypothetical protein
VSNMSTLAEAQKIAADLEERRRALIERGQEIAETRKRISFAVIVDGDAKTRETAEREAKALEKLPPPAMVGASAAADSLAPSAQQDCLNRANHECSVQVHR